MREKALEKKVWAVVGATNKKEKYGNKIFKALVKKGYTVYPISPNYKEIEGVKAYRTLKEVPEQIDVADFVVKPNIGIKSIQDAKKAGIETVWLQPGASSKEIIEFAEDNEIIIIDDCVIKALRSE